VKLKHQGFELYHNEYKNDSKASIKNQKDKNDRIDKFDKLTRKEK